MLELMVVIATLGILLAIAASNATQFLGPLRLRSAARQVATDLRLLRTKAITQNTSFRMTFGGGRYYAERWNGASWQEHALYSKATTAGARTFIDITPPVTSSGATVAFEARGTIPAETALTLTHPGISTRRVIVTVAGQVSVQ